MIDDCLNKIVKEIPRTREYYTVQGLMLYSVQVPRVSHTRLELPYLCKTRYLFAFMAQSEKVYKYTVRAEDNPG